MKILITTDLYTVQTNGVVTSVKNLSQELLKDGHDVRILTVAENIHSKRIDNVYYIRSLPLGAVYPDVRMPTSYHHQLIKELIAWRPEVIHSQCEFFSFQFAQYISKKTGAPIVHTYHTLYEQYASYILHVKGVGEKAVGELSRLRLKQVQTIIAPTRKVEQTLRSYGITSPICVIPSGIRLDAHKNRLLPEERLRMRMELGIEPEDKVLLNLGRLGAEKNVDELIRFFAQACEKTEANLKLLIVGGGPAREQLERMTVSMELADKVIFTGMVAPETVSSYYQLGDVFVSASTSETQGLTYLEACANGLPLLCRQDPCLEDVLLPGDNGYAYMDCDSFCDYLQQMLCNEQWRSQAGECSRLVARNYSPDVFGAAVQEVYRLVLGQYTMQEEPVG